MFVSAVGHSEGMETRTVTLSVIEQCQAQLNGRVPNAGILFSSVRNDYDAMLSAIVEAFPGIALAGCSAGGELSAVGGSRQDSICLVLFASDTISMASGMVRTISGGEGDCKSGCGTDVIARALDRAISNLDGPPALCLAFGNNLNACPVGTVDTLHNHLGPDCLVFGGYAASDIAPQDEVFQFCDSEAFSGGASFLLFSGPVQTACCLSNSWAPMGSRAVVDESEHIYINRMAGRPAMQFYQDVFGPHDEPVVEMPLAVFENDDSYYIRVATEFKPETQQVRFDSHIPEGSVVQFTEATPEGILSNTRSSLGDLSKGLDFAPKSAIVVSCMARRNILGLQAQEEVKLIQEQLPDHLPFAGFYSYGEISPAAENLPPRYHHCTMATLLIGEKGNQDKLAPLPRTDAMNTHESDKDLKIRLLEQKLERAQQNQSRLEYTKSLFERMQKRINKDLIQAKTKIEQQHSILKESLTLAQQVQQKLLPQDQPIFDGFEIAGRSVYCDETGGDYFDYLILPESKDRLSVVVGDVAGHGIASALLMATARALLRMRVSKAGSPGQIISDLNRFLSSDVQGTGRFMSLFYLVLDTAEKNMTWVRAGHDPALRYIPSSDSFEEMHGEGLVLGVMDDWKYKEYSARMAEPGEIILIGTDGIWETRDERKVFFGKKRLMSVIRENHDRSANDIVEACLAALSDFRMTLPVHDDVTLVVIKVSK